MNEIWKDVVGYEQYYQISNLNQNIEINNGEIVKKEEV